MTPELEAKIRKLQGPVLVLGASGFVGANLLRMLLAVARRRVRDAVSLPRLAAGRAAGGERHPGRPSGRRQHRRRPREGATAHPLQLHRLRRLFLRGRGAIHETNFNLTVRLLQRLQKLPLACYVHSGSSSEYGDRAAGPTEDDSCRSPTATTRCRRSPARTCCSSTARRRSSPARTCGCFRSTARSRIPRASSRRSSRWGSPGPIRRSSAGTSRATSSTSTTRPRPTSTPRST